MKRFLLPLAIFIALHAAATAIGGVDSFAKNSDGITITCKDHSQVGLFALAPDLIRVRAAFTHALPTRDHSWAIDKTSWQTVQLTVKEDPRSIVLSTSELEVVINRDPLLIEFRDARTHRL